MRTFTDDFKRFFLRGLAAVLPTILTILLFAWLYDKIGRPINSGAKYLVCKTWLVTKGYEVPPTFPEEFSKKYAGENIDGLGDEFYFIENYHVTKPICDFWNDYLFLVGFLLAIVAIYIIGKFLTSYMGRLALKVLEKGLSGIPLVNQVYSSIKQVTDFLISDDRKMGYSKVVAVEYPRKGIWSLGLATNAAMKTFDESLEGDMITVFIPSSPTPITGYTITVRKNEVIEIPLTIDEALRFTISGGVVIPPAQLLTDKVFPVGDGAHPKKDAEIESTVMKTQENQL